MKNAIQETSCKSENAPNAEVNEKKNSTTYVKL